MVRTLTSSSRCLASMQTGSGKTYTVAGDTQRYDQRGIIPRSLHHLFSEIDLREDREVTVKCSYLEIYNEVRTPTPSLSCRPNLLSS